MKVKSLSRLRLFATPWTIACTRLFYPWDFSRQEYQSGLPFSSPGDLPDPGIEPRSPTLQADALPSEPPGKLSEDLSRQFPASLDHRETYFSSPPWAPFKGYRRSASHSSTWFNPGRGRWQVLMADSWQQYHGSLWMKHSQRFFAWPNFDQASWTLSLAPRKDPSVCFL